MMATSAVFFLLSAMLLLATSSVCLGDDVIKATFQRTGSLGDKVCPPSRRVFEAEARSLASCVAMATERVDCLGVSYHHGDKACYGCDTSEDRTAQFEPFPGAVFYRRLTVIPEGYVNISGYIIKFVGSPPLAYDAASDACTYSGGHLVKIDTPEMNTAIQSFLNNTDNGYTNVNFWIQLREVEGVWQFADGSIPPDLGSDWCPGQPNDESSLSNCAFLWRTEQFMWADWDCKGIFGYICELAY